MKVATILLAATGTLLAASAHAGQAPFAAGKPNVPMTHKDRVYVAEQFSNTVSVIDPIDNRLLGVIRLGEPQPANFSPLYRGRCWCTAWASHPTAKCWRSCRSGPTR